MGLCCQPDSRGARLKCGCLGEAVRSITSAVPCKKGLNSVGTFAFVHTYVCIVSSVCVQNTSMPVAGHSSGFISHAAPALSAVPSAPSSLHTSSLSVTHSQRASSMSGVPSSPVSTPPRPSILIRKRSHDK